MSIALFAAGCDGFCERQTVDNPSFSTPQRPSISIRAVFIAGGLLACTLCSLYDTTLETFVRSKLTDASPSNARNGKTENWWEKTRAAQIND